MRSQLLKRLVGILLVCTPLSAQAATWYVQSGGAGTKDGTSWQNAFATVTAGLQAAKSGDTVNVWAGTYPERITLPSGVRLVGGWVDVNGNVVWYPHFSILDGQNGGSVVTVAPGAGIETRLSGFTLQNGTGTPVGGKTYGGGVYSVNASPTIQQNLFVENHTDVGGGAYAQRSTAYFYGNEFRYNTAREDGGAIASREGNPRIQLGFFRSNQANRGGAISTTAGPGAFIASNIFEGNRATTDGSAVYLDRGQVQNNTILRGTGPAAGSVSVTSAGNVSLTNNIIAFNSSGVRVGTDATVAINNNDVYQNAAANYIGIADQTGQGGNISAAPALADPHVGDYYPVPGSPVVDKGNASVVQPGAQDFYRYARVQGVTVDMGAAERTEAAPLVAIRVKPASEGGDDANDGSDWTKAKATIQAAVTVAQAVYGEVWVAAGTYAQAVRIENKDALVYGGFAGTETVRNQRNPQANPTILNGEGLGGSVVSIIGSPSTGQFIGNGTVVDGFTIRNGSGTAHDTNGVIGGGILISEASPIVAGNIIEDNRAATSAGWGGGIAVLSGAPYISHNTLRRNTAVRGGGIYVDGTYPRIRQNVFEQNAATSTNGTPGQGGGLFLANSLTDLDAFVTGNTFTANQAQHGAGMFVSGGPKIIRDNQITGNKASATSDVALGGGIYSEGAYILNNVMLNNESAGVGGAIFATGNPQTIANNLIARNQAPDTGGLYVADTDANVYNNTIAYNSNIGLVISAPNARTINVANNILAYGVVGLNADISPGSSVLEFNNCAFGNSIANFEGITPSTLDIIANPEFVDASANNFRLLSTSPCIDAGSVSVVAADYQDLDLQQRILGAQVDIGAYEYYATQFTGLQNVVVALRIAGGLEGIDTSVMDILNVEKSGASSDRIDLFDATRLARKAAGLDL